MNALEPVLSRKAVKLHYKGNNAGYVKRANALLGKRGRLTPGEQVHLDFNLAGAELHRLWWEGLAPLVQHNKPPRALMKALGFSYSRLRKDMVEIGLDVMGSGWVVLSDGPMGPFVSSYPDHAYPPDGSVRPLILLDCWEHSSLLDYGVDRKGYLEDLFELINWNVVGRRYTTRS